MKGIRGVFLLSLMAVVALSAAAQQVIATVPVGVMPGSLAVNSTTNKIYVANSCAANQSGSCNGGTGTVTVIDGATNIPVSVNVGYDTDSVAVNPVTNRIYAVNQCSDQTCGSGGTVTVIDGASNTVIATVTLGDGPYGLAVNSVTNKIYVTNGCGNDPTCGHREVGTVSVIDGATNTVVATVNVGARPSFPVVNTVTNKIYVANECGTDPTCGAPFVNGTVTVIDGATNSTQSVNVGVLPRSLDVNTLTNKIYVVDQCANDPTCGGTGGVTVIDGATLATTEVAIGGFEPNAIAVNSTTNKIYVPSRCEGNPSCQGERQGTVTVIDGVTLATTSTPGLYGPYNMAINTVTNKIYVADQCGRDPLCTNLPIDAMVTVVDGVSLGAANIPVGVKPEAIAVNPATNRIYVANFCGDSFHCSSYNGTVSVIDGTPPTALQFVPLSQPCRAVDTRPSQGGMGPIQGGTSQNFAISGEGACAVLPNAAVYSLNVTVVPQETLGYLTIWPAGQPQPVVSTLNSLDGRIKADAAIVPAGAGGAVSIYVTDTTNVIVDVNGYFTPPTGSTLEFYPLTPCRVADTRYSNYPQGLGSPSLTGGQERKFPILNATTTCSIPASGVAAYSLNFTVVPHGGLGFLTVWPTGQNRPTVSTLNDVLGNIIANAAIVVAGTNGDVSAYATDNTDLVIDINGYFAPAGTGGLSLYPVTPCRLYQPYGPYTAGEGFLDVWQTSCAASSLSQAYTFNATVVPVAGLGYLTLWPNGDNQPVVSTLNALDGSITSNMAIVPAGNHGLIDVYLSDSSELLLDISSYFAP